MTGKTCWMAHESMALRNTAQHRTRSVVSSVLPDAHPGSHSQLAAEKFFFGLSQPFLRTLHSVLDHSRFCGRVARRMQLSS